MCSTVILHGICDVPRGSTLFDNRCYSMTASQIAAYPTITILLNNSVSLSVSGSEYIFYEASIGLYCMGVGQCNFLTFN